jgi:hypothetical protein
MLVDERSTCHVEIDWDEVEEHYQGALNCRGSIYDLLYYFERDPDDGKCYFVLRSEEGGFPEGYEHRWELGDEVRCRNLEASVELGYDLTLTVKAVEKVTPQNCTGCQCLCECVCLEIIWPGDDEQPWGTRCRGKLCWEDEENAWVGPIVCNNPYDSEFSYDAKVEWRRRGEFCDQFPYESCEECDPACVPVLQIPEIGITDAAVTRINPCEDRNVNYVWEIETDDGHALTVSMECARCGDTCARIICCEGEPWNEGLPDTMWMSFVGPNYVCDGCDPAFIPDAYPLYYAGPDVGVIHWWEARDVPIRVFTGRPFDDGCGPPNIGNEWYWGDEWNYIKVRIGCVDAINPDAISGSSIWIAQLGCNFDDTWGPSLDITVLDCDPFMAELSVVAGGGGEGAVPSNTMCQSGSWPPPGINPPGTACMLWMVTL